MAKAGNKLFLISNMYPSKENIRYGIFVENFEKAISNDLIVEKIVITKKYGFMNKLIAYIILYFKILLLLIRAKGKDLIYVHFPLHVAPVLLLLKAIHKKIVLNFHGSDLIFETKFKKLLSFFLTPILRKTFIVVPSEYFKIKLINEFKVSNSKVLVYPSGGVNRKIFFPEKYGNNKKFTIGFVSNFLQEKGWETFLRSVKIIKEENLVRNIEVIMVGDGLDKEKINQMITANDIKVQFYTNQTQTQLAKIYNKLDVFIFPTFRESLGLVGIEAMACGVPVIASKVDGPMEYVKDGFNGFLFEKQNIEDLVKKILVFFNLAKIEKSIMSDNCKKTALRYDSVKVKRLLVKFLKQID